MARRSPMNPRYGKDAKVGSTRRSASSLKPKREAGEAPGKPVPAAKPKAKTRPKLSEALPTSPEIKKWRTIWYVLLGVMVLTYVIEIYVPAIRASRVAQSIGFGITSGAFVAAMYIELVKIRLLRKELIEQQKASKKKGSS